MSTPTGRPGEPILLGTPQSEALSLLKRAVSTRGIAWPRDARQVRSVAGFRADVADLPGPETVVWGTLGGQNGLLALFKDNRLLATVNRTLGTIDRVGLISLPGLPHFGLQLEDTYDALSGAFFRQRRARLYVWDGRGLREVWRGDLAVDQFSHERWRRPDGPNRWHLHRTRGHYSIHDSTLTYTVQEEELEAPGSPDAPIPAESAFQSRSHRERTQLFHWDPRLRRFRPSS